MKKIFLLLSVILTCVIVFVSCAFLSGEPKSAEALWNKVDERMDSFSSYEAKLYMDITFFVDGKERTGSGSGRVVEADKGTEDYYFYQTVSTKIKPDPNSAEEKFTSTFAYNEGSVFIANKAGVSDQKFYSEMSTDEFWEFKNGDMLADLSPLNADNTEFVKKDDGTWSLVYWGFGKKSVEALSKSTGVYGGDLGAELADIKLTLLADESFLPVQMTVEYIFTTENTEETPTVVLVADFMNFGQATRITGPIKPEDYNKIDDVRVLYMLHDMMEERINAESGSFTLDVTQNVTFLGKKTEYTETDTVSYGVKGSGFFYDVEAEAENNMTNISYENGVKIIGVNKIEQTEKEAREYIEQLVDIACYDFSRVTEIEIPEEGVYKLRIDSVNKHVYKSVFEGIDITGLDGRYTSGAQIITFTVENDEIVKIENELEINGRIVKNYNSYGMGVDFFSTIVFN